VKLTINTKEQVKEYAINNMEKPEILQINHYESN
jgi:hypothetical protein